MTKNTIDPSRIERIYHLLDEVELYTEGVRQDEVFNPHFEFCFELLEKGDPLEREEHLCKIMAEALKHTLESGCGPITWGQKPIINSEKTKIYARFARPGSVWPTDVIENINRKVNRKLVKGNQND